jgi:riboflavin biosynthesis pyrimidine reductase
MCYSAGGVTPDAAGRTISHHGPLAAAGLLDELCLTVSPLMAGGDTKRILAGPALPSGPGWQIRSLCEQDGFLFLRYRPS